MDLQFFLAQLENGVENVSEEYNEGYDDVLQSVAYAIRSEEIKSLGELESIIEQMIESADECSGEYNEGYKDAVDRCKKSLMICA